MKRYLELTEKVDTLTAAGGKPFVLLFTKDQLAKVEQKMTNLMGASTSATSMNPGLTNEGLMAGIQQGDERLTILWG